MLVVFRNPKDTLVSYYHFYNSNPVLPSGQSWDSFFSNFMKGEGAFGKVRGQPLGEHVAPVRVLGEVGRMMGVT